MRRFPARVVAGTALALAATLSVSACGSSDSATTSSSSGPEKVSVVGFSVMEKANQKEFADFNMTPAGKGVTFSTSYGSSGDQSRAVLAGLKADEVHLSLEPDVSKLVDAGIVPKDWNAGPNKGILTQSVVVFAVRPGNPKHIKTWDDLIKPGVKVVTPNPGSSGSAKWNLLAALGSQTSQGKSEAQGEAFLKKLIGNVVAFPSSSKDATTAFEGGTGDVLLSYENEAIEARQSGAKLDYIVPPQTILIQNPGALTATANSSAKALYQFQQSKQGQTDYAEEGFRPLDSSIKVDVKGANDPSNPFPAPSQKLFTVDDTFGGWSSANTKYFDDTNGIITKLIAASGKS